MEWRPANDGDLDLLAEWNEQLIVDEGHRNPMTAPELYQRMANWLAGEYEATIFSKDGAPVAYGLYRENEAEIYLRQFFVRRDLMKTKGTLFGRSFWARGYCVGAVGLDADRIRADIRDRRRLGNQNEQGELDLG